MWQSFTFAGAAAIEDGTAANNPASNTLQNTPSLVLVRSMTCLPFMPLATVELRPLHMSECNSDANREPLVII
jgi:hypothetical protein